MSLIALNARVSIDCFCTVYSMIFINEASAIYISLQGLSLSSRGAILEFNPFELGRLNVSVNSWFTLDINA